MKTLKLTLIISLLIISASVFATGGKKEPPLQTTWVDEILKILTIK